MSRRNGEFQMTTALDTNSYVQNGNLYIMPTLTSDVIGYDRVLNGGNYTLDQCTATVNNLVCSSITPLITFHPCPVDEKRMQRPERRNPCHQPSYERPLEH